MNQAMATGTFYHIPTNESNKMRLAIVGSVSFRTEELFNMAEDQIQFYISEYLLDIEKIVSGGAIGVDSMAEKWANYYNIPVKIHLPKNRRWAPEGFKERNLKIAEDCTHLLCIRDKESKTYGSGWTSDRAKDMGKVVWRYDL
jgi:hypothetical protein